MIPCLNFSTSRPSWESRSNSSSLRRSWSTLSWTTRSTPLESVRHNRARLSPTLATYKRPLYTKATTTEVPADNSQLRAFSLSTWIKRSTKCTSNVTYYCIIPLMYHPQDWTCTRLSESTWILQGDRGSTEVKVLCYKLEGRWFYPSWWQWNFSLT